jgi:23S rRNA (guanosine2251-2'-O)-methyltransferase
MGALMDESQIIPGFHAAREALLSGHVKIREVWVAEGKRGARVEEILRIARDRGIPILFKKGSELEAHLPGVAHQGIALLAQGFSYSDLEGMVSRSLKQREHALLLAADHVTDEGNLGAIIRTAAFFGVHGLFLPKDRSARVSPKVLKRSAGAYAHVPVARVVNLGRTLDLLKKKGFWIIGTAENGPESIYRFDWKRDLVLVLGGEARGLSRSVRERCHQVVRIPLKGEVSSLNVAVAGGVILSEIIRRRGTGEGGAEIPSGRPLKRVP